MAAADIPRGVDFLPVLSLIVAVSLDPVQLAGAMHVARILAVTVLQVVDNLVPSDEFTAWSLHHHFQVKTFL